MTRGRPAAWEDAAARERRLHLLQLAVLLLATIGAAVALSILGRGIVSADNRRQVGADHLAALVAVRDRMRAADTAFWEDRARGGAGAPAGVRALARLAPDLLRGLKARDPDLTGAEARAADRAIAAAEALVPLAGIPTTPPGSIRDLEALRSAQPHRRELLRSVDRWATLQQALVDRAARDGHDMASRLSLVLIVILTGLASAASVAWFLIDRLRRRVVLSVARQAEERGAIIGAMQDGLVAVGPDGRILEVNERFCELTGLTRDTLVGSRAPRPYWPERDADTLASLEGRHLAGEAGDSDIELRRADGALVPVTYSAAPLVDHRGRPGGYVATVKDATERRTAQHEQRRRAAEQAALGRVATAAASLRGSSLDGLFALVAEEVARLFGVEGGRVARFDGADVAIVGSWSDGRGAAAGPSRGPSPLDAGAAIAAVHRSGRPARADGGSPRAAHSSIAAPIRTGTGVWGAVSAVTAGPAAFPPGAEEHLARFAELVGLSVSNAEGRARLAAQATTDPLTGLANHREFHERLAEEVARARRHGRDLSLILLDIDNFKATNDAHGHQVGDAVIAEVGRRLAGGTRPGELAARIGGEEFAVILPEIAGLHAWTAADRVRRTVCSRPFPAIGALTLSAGVCDLDRADSAEELFRLADGALYWAKANGRDTAFLYSPEVVRELSAAERAERLERVQALAGLRGLARAVDAKDPSTKRHSERVADIAVAVARELGWDDERCLLLREAGLLHDVGKIGVPDAVLFKPARLTDDELAAVRQHAALGADMVTDILGAEQVAWVRHHHERVDGGGYPAGLAGDAIPLGARILAVAESWDVMTSVRAYAPARTREEARAELASCAGGQFDPQVVAAMDRLLDRGDLSAAERAGAGEAAAPA
ncbi:MAG: diguanylate cyclase [Actinomycetota bacterium]